MHILVINGPNLNLLGTREPELYGTETLADLEAQWHQRARRHGATIEAFQSNHEGAIIDTIGDGNGRFDGLVINAGALSHYSYAITDAVEAVGMPTVEVHISNIYEREVWRHTSVLTDVCDLDIVGRGVEGYLHAIDHLVAMQSHPPVTAQYGDAPDTVLDLRTPTGPGPHPVVLLIHGGFWRDIWKRDLMDPMAVALTDSGWATTNIEYRRGGGSYTAASYDLRQAVQWVKDHAADHGLDTDRIVVVGHSAGGYLALRLAHDNPGIAGVVSLAAVSDLAAMAESQSDDDPVVAFLGASRDEAPRLWAQAELSGDPSVPVHLIHGVDDETVDPAQTESYTRLRGGSTEATMVARCGHMELIDPTSEAWPSVVAALGVFSS
ncbi:MAG: hypothetical protein BMS9Abin12_0418 [Acidimicrobiia bacterium]|nr:MAG: hypothetical protein BMS9Abin12_0418 [Acidimicrobiia bacterium]